MIVSKLTIQGFKSIESVELELGHVNVFIGANGSGKSNLLEAFGILAAAASGKVDEESIIRRGGRPGGIFQPKFVDTQEKTETRVTAESEQDSYTVELQHPVRKMSGWLFNREHWVHNGQDIVARSNKNSIGDPESGLAALKLAEISPNSEALKFLKTLANYTIYTPDTPVLRGWAQDPQSREPVGLSGGRLADAIEDLDSDSSACEKLTVELKNAVQWFDSFGSIRPPNKKRGPQPRRKLIFLDKYFHAGKDGGVNALDSNDVNEGVLYQLFLGVLCLHPQSPALFAIEGADHGLNPLLAKHLIKTLCDWLLNDERPRQLLMTTHNPLVLDGLPLQDDRVRLFAVDRDNHGKTVVNRVKITPELLAMADKGWTMSRLWTNNLIGGMPNV